MTLSDASLKYDTDYSRGLIRHNCIARSDDDQYFPEEDTWNYLDYFRYKFFD
jgi:hypothetical protein